MNDPTLPSNDELVEARERADAGHRLLFPHLFPAHTKVPAPLNAKSAGRAASKLMDARAAVMDAANEVPLEGEELLHELFNCLVNQLDDIGVALGERFGS